MFTYDNSIEGLEHLKKQQKEEFAWHKKIMHIYLKELKKEKVISIKERRILAYRLDGMTLGEVGDILMGKSYCSRERIRQVEAKARERIRQHEAGVA